VIPRLTVPPAGEKRAASAFTVGYYTTSQAFVNGFFRFYLYILPVSKKSKLDFFEKTGFA